MDTNIRPPVVLLDRCKYDKEHKTLSLASEFFGMPKRFVVRSHVTGRDIVFAPITEDHPKYDQDGWDGEQMIYEPVTPIPTVVMMTIYNQY